MDSVCSVFVYIFYPEKQARKFHSNRPEYWELHPERTECGRLKDGSTINNQQSTIRQHSALPTHNAL